ncbi:DUF6177 family protein [Yinghuangia sp. YIM S09857]|uniref:DUF6177 family protein n=1 Tax=Yinghuangia sp. YIM S09857 TaxID=3436929 RepID=UPI003F53DF30
MTTDLIALTERMPDRWSLVAGLMAGGPDNLVGVEGEGALIRLADAEGRPLVFVEAPLPVHTPGEVERLLGVAVDGPVWWTEVRAATAAPDAELLARTVTTRLVALLGGSVWPPGSEAADRGAAAVAGVGTASVRAAAQPAVDVLTGKVAAVIQDRPLVAMTTWLSDALRAAALSGRAVQIVTPPHSRLTLPTRTVLGRLPNRWVVQDGLGGYHDGMSGTELRWHNGAFESAERIAEPFAEATERAERATEADVRARGTPERQLLITVVTRRPAAHELLLGGGAEAVWRRIAGAAPGGWGTAEPANLRWSREELTGVARSRAPEPSWFVIVGPSGRASIGALRVVRTRSGVEEHLTFALGCPAGVEPPVGQLVDLADELAADHGLVSMLAQSRLARADLTVPAHLEPAPEPEAFAVGAEGADGLKSALAAGSARRMRVLDIGQGPRRGVFCPLREIGWQGFQELMRGAKSADQARLTWG